MSGAVTSVPVNVGVSAPVFVLTPPVDVFGATVAPVEDDEVEAEDADDADDEEDVDVDDDEDDVTEDDEDEEEVVADEEDDVDEEDAEDGDVDDDALESDDELSVVEPLENSCAKTVAGDCPISSATNTSEATARFAVMVTGSRCL